MSTLASLKTQVAQAACFICLPVNIQQAIKAYLLAVNAGGSLDPKTLLSQARGFKGVQSGYLPAYQAVFANIKAGGSGDISSSVSSSKCDVICLTPEDSLRVQLVSLATNAGLTTDPKTLARLAACFACIDSGNLIMLQTFLMGVISGTIPVPAPVTTPGTPPGPGGPPPTIPPSIRLLATKGFAYPPAIIQVTIGDAITAWQGSFGCPMPTGITAIWNIDGTTSVSWSAVPAVVDHTEIWTSPDGIIPFILSSSVASPGTSATLGASVTAPFVKFRFCISSSACCVFSSVIQATNGADPLVSSWKTRAIANGGTPSIATLNCLNTFCIGIRAQTYFAKLKSVNFLAPDDFRCAMTPLIVHAQDQGLWLAQTGAFPSGGSAFVSAINAELGPNGFRCDDCINPNVAGNNYTPASLFTARDNWGVTVYQTTNDGLHGPQGMEFGVVDAGGNAQQGSANAGGTEVLYADDLGTAFSVAFSFYGYYSFNVSDATTRRVFSANSIHPHALSMSSGAIFAGNLCTLAFPWAGTNQNTVHTPASGNWRSFIAAHDSLTTSESLDFFTRIQALRVCLGTGFL